MSENEIEQPTGLGVTRKPYAPPAVTRVPLMPQELFIADCVKTVNVCHPLGFHQQIKS